MAKIHLCVLDCSSIQRYVFGSNKLKSNIGASHLVENIYKLFIPKILRKMYDNDESKFVFNQWETDQGEILLLKNENLLMETGYIGGGNALLLFRTEADTKQFIFQWTKELMRYTPGIVPVVASMEVDSEYLAEGIKAIFKLLTKNKNEYIAETTLPRHGITNDCRISGLSTEIQHPDPHEVGTWISSTVCSKLAVSKDADDALEAEYYDALKSNYKFGNDLENLGQSKNTENHIAIVHIDGNRLGVEFIACEDLQEKRRLSLKVKEAVKKAMIETLSLLIKKLDYLNKNILTPIPKDHKNDPNEKQKLPVRPMVLNGDDITFICDARLGFFLAETFMREFAKEPIEIKLVNGGINKIKLSSCAGIAIIRTKYPFYRGYMLAEALCASAKRKWREEFKIKNEDYHGSWLDFHISYRGLSGSLPEIRHTHYNVGGNLLLWRPWEIDGTDDNSFNEFKNILKAIVHNPNKDQRWPKSKLNELAQALMQGPQDSEEFLKISKARGLVLPDIKGQNYNISGWTSSKEKTPYYDILEAMEFYPECLL
ncbi:hypothetical protein JW964_06245 [candidate division KSB1 bacterium]|nr:hypothetical protein [candidate division KSB1 bacterium]